VKVRRVVSVMLCFVCYGCPTERKVMTKVHKSIDHTQEFAE